MAGMCKLVYGSKTPLLSHNTMLKEPWYTEMRKVPATNFKITMKGFFQIASYIKGLTSIR